MHRDYLYEHIPTFRFLFQYISFPIPFLRVPAQESETPLAVAVPSSRDAAPMRPPRAKPGLAHLAQRMSLDSWTSFRNASDSCL